MPRGGTKSSFQRCQVCRGCREFQLVCLAENWKQRGCLGNGSWLMTLNGQSSVWDISNKVVAEIIKKSRRIEFRIVSDKWSTIRGQKEKKEESAKDIE